jgi:NAD(P)-dependent dehydrogenase (short-subunit alcohol dehydrogenase family)
MERRKTTIEETGWNELCNIYSKPADMKTRFSKFLIRIRCAVGGQQAQVARMYDNFCRNQQQPDAKKYILKRKKQTTVFPAGVFAESQTVMLEGIPFQAPGNIRKYLTLSYGDDYKHVTEPKYVMPPQMIISARVSYTQVWKEAGNFEKYCKERRKNVRRLVRSRSMKECFNECWDYVEFWDSLKPEDQEKLIILKADMSSYEEMMAFVTEVKEKAGHVDWLVSNAGISTYDKFQDYTFEEWNNIVNTNLSIPVFMVKELMPVMTEGGSVLFMGSYAGRQAYSSSVVYGVTKAAIHFLTKSLVKEFEPKGITVNAIAPGFIQTPWHENRTPESYERINRKIALLRGHGDSHECGNRH